MTAMQFTAGVAFVTWPLLLLFFMALQHREPKHTFLQSFIAAIFVTLLFVVVAWGLRLLLP
jgi:membrane-bound metal-dependent hydrolase YbcI (DUF457 family)